LASGPQATRGAALSLLRSSGSVNLLDEAPHDDAPTQLLLLVGAVHLQGDGGPRSAGMCPPGGVAGCGDCDRCDRRRPPEVLGFDLGDSEDGEFWTAFLRSLKARGLGGVQLVISGAHTGLKQAIGAVTLGSAWQGCRVHFMRNVLTQVPRRGER
jgi:hypothetical protein